jgi:hypothetical protein
MKEHLRRSWEMLHPFARPLYILAAWVKLFAATRSKRKFNSPVSFDEKRPSRGSGCRIPSVLSPNGKLRSADEPCPNFSFARDQPVLGGNTFDEAEITGLLRCSPQLEAPAAKSISSTIE